MGQWFGILQQDGPGSEHATSHADPASTLRVVNESRRRKGLPPLELPGGDGTTRKLSRREQEEADYMALDAELKPGMKVGTPHGVGEIVKSDQETKGWLIKMPDGVTRFYHAWDVNILPQTPAKA